MKFYYRILSFILILAVFASCVPVSFAAEGTDTKAGAPETRAASTMIVGDWLFTDTIVNRGTNGAEKIMREYAATGVTDVYLLCKGISGRLAWASKVSGTVRSSSTRDYLKEACDAAKPYGIRVHAWMMASRDTHYVTNMDSNSPFYHFRVGTASSVNQYINLRDSGYRNYVSSLVKELVANYNIAGIHLDTIRYGALYYDWGLNARNELISRYGITKAEYNAATKAMCVTGSYKYTTNADGYYVYSSSGTTASGVSFSGALAGNGSTDALNGAKKFAQLRKDTVTDFVKIVKDAAGSGKVISCAIMPEPCTSNYESALYGQSPADLGKVVDYVAVMSYACEYNAASTWPVTLTTACTNVGCKAIAGIQTYPSEGSSDPDPNGQTVYTETSGIRKAMKSNSGILGYAFFRGSYLSLAGAKVVDSKTVDITVTPGDDAGNATKYVFTLQNGVTCSAISNKTGWASGTTHSISSDKKTVTITNGGSTVLSEGSTASFRLSISGTVDEAVGFAQLRAYTGSGYSEGYGYCGTLTQSHTHSYTSKVTKEATCAAQGTKTYTCSCGSTYTEAIAQLPHTFTATGSANGMTTYTCSVCNYSYTGTCGATHSCIETWPRENRTHFTVCYDCGIKATEQCVFEISSIVNPTATAAGSVSYVCVGSNSLSYQTSHDAFSGKGCGRTYSVTLPAGSGYTYVNNFNGTHTRTNTATEDSISNLAHVYTNGVCPCGEVERSFINLQFTNYSVANKLGYWTIHNLRGNVDTQNGIFSGIAYGTDPYLHLRQDGDVVNYKIKPGDIVEIRLKSKLLSGSADKLQFFYTTTADKSYNQAKSVTTAHQISSNGDYQVIRLNLNKNVGQTINALRLDPYSNCSTNFKAELELDYIYVGSPEQAPSTYPNSVFIDFSNNNASAGRYLANDIYSGYHFDLGYWFTNSKRTAPPVIDNKTGTMTLSVAPTTDNYDSTGHSPYVQTSDSTLRSSSIPLNYVPSEGDVIQLRVKFDNCVATAEGSGRIRLYYIKNIDDGFSGVDATDYITLKMDQAALSSGKWVTYTAPVGEAFASAAVINAIRPSFNNVRSAEGKTGTITIDYIYVGDSRNTPEQANLYFDFTNTLADAQRYNNKSYGYVNFDASIPAQNWWYANAASSSISEASGTMETLMAATIEDTQYPCLYWDTAKGGSYGSYPLSYQPDHAEVMQIRFKMENFRQGDQVGADGTPKAIAPYLLLQYFADESNTCKSASEGKKYDPTVLSAGKFTTVTVPLNDTFRNEEEIRKLRIFFGGVESLSATDQGKLTVDYIYIGSEADMPVKDELFFDFTNTAEDRDRYATLTYGGVNYDSPTSNAWYYYKDVCATNLTVDNQAGTLTVNAVGQMPQATHYPSVYFDTVADGKYASMPLKFSPHNAEVYQIRFKLENFRVGDQEQADGTSKTVNPYVLLSYYLDGDSTGKSAFTGVKLDPSVLTSGKYTTVTVDLNDTFRSEKEIHKLRIFFGGMESISASKVGKITVDYIYVGSKANLPSKNALHFTFGNTAEDQHRYDSMTYGNVNFDSSAPAQNWWYANTSATTINHGDGVLEATMLAALEDTKYPVIYFDTAKGGAYSSYPLHYSPDQAEFMQVRFKMTNFRQGDQVGSDGNAKAVAPYLLLQYFADESNTCKNGSEGVKYNPTVLTSGQYATVTVPLNDTFRSEEEIRKLRIFFGGVESLSATNQGKLTVDYIYVGPRSALPIPAYTVTFAGADGSTLLTLTVAKGGEAYYTGATPKKAADATNHYSFKGWNKALTNITADTTLTAQFTATAHSFTYTKVDGTNHKGTCSCGYSKTVAHSWDAGTVTTQPTCTAAGVKTFTCSACKATKTQAVSAKGHTPVTDKAVAPTCTAPGKTEGSHCAVCNAVITAQKTVPATGHSYTYTSNSESSHTVTCKNCSYKGTEPHSFANGTCTCGEAEVKEPVQDATLKLYHSLNLASDISVNFLVPMSTLAGFDMDTVYAECRYYEYNGNTRDKEVVVRLTPVLNGSYYYFTLKGLTAVHMTAELRCTLYGTKDRQPYYSPVDIYSISKYAYSQLNNSTNSDTLKRLCADLLRYGSELQLYKGYRTDTLADANMTVAHKAYLSDIEAISFGNTNVTGAELSAPVITWYGKALDLNTKVGLIYVINTANYTGDISKLTLKVTYLNQDGLEVTETLTDPTSYNNMANRYAFRLESLLAAELRTVLTARIYEGNTPLSNTLTYSCDTYGNNKSGQLLTVCKALFAYSDSAKAYFTLN